MHDIKQITIILKGLRKERERIMSEIARIGLNIDKKKSLIQKMFSYVKEYHQDGNFQKTKSSAMLLKNLDSFSGQIHDVIMQTEVEIESLVKNREIILNRMVKADQKIKAMELFENRFRHNEFVKDEKIEQMALDESTLIKRSRGLNE